MFKFEDELIFPVHTWISNQGLHAKIEVPTMGKIPDLIGCSGDNIEIAIELKLSNWKRALYQAVIYASFAEKSYVAMPEAKMNLLIKNISEFRKWGIGILIIKNNGEVEVLQTPYKTAKMCNRRNE